MRQREIDHRSLIAGFLFVAIGLVYLIDQATGIEVRAAWVLPVLLIGLGVAGLASSAARRRNDELE